MNPEAPMHTAVQKAEGMLDTVKTKFNVDELVDNFNMQQAGMYAGVGLAGFLTGFLLKKYSQYLIFAILLIGGIFGLQYLGYISTFEINWTMIQQQVGMQPLVGNGVTMTSVWQWVRANFAFVLSGSVGFLLGLKVG